MKSSKLTLFSRGERDYSIFGGQFFSSLFLVRNVLVKINYDSELYLQSVFDGGFLPFHGCLQSLNSFLIS